MRRSPLNRNKSALKRRKQLSRRNAARRAKAFAKDFRDQAFVHRVQSTPCLICGTLPSECAHVRSRGAGGDWRDIVPLCRAHHAEQHSAGIETFQRRYGITLADHTFTDDET